MVELTAAAFNSAIGNWKSAMTSHARGSRQDDLRLGRLDCKELHISRCAFRSRSAGRGRPGPRLGTPAPTVGSVALVESKHRFVGTLGGELPHLRHLPTPRCRD